MTDVASRWFIPIFVAAFVVAILSLRAYFSTTEDSHTRGMNRRPESATAHASPSDRPVRRGFPAPPRHRSRDIGISQLTADLARRAGPKTRYSQDSAVFADALDRLDNHGLVRKSLPHRRQLAFSDPIVQDRRLVKLEGQRPALTALESLDQTFGAIHGLGRLFTRRLTGRFLALGL